MTVGCVECFKNLLQHRLLLTPKMLGSAMGLRVIACMRAPDMARDAPASTPNMVRGTRAMTTWEEKLPSPVRAAITPAKPTDLAP